MLNIIVIGIIIVAATKNNTLLIKNGNSLVALAYMLGSVVIDIASLGGIRCGKLV